jgi:acyl-CoA reductase-like NAD-dependent aldehyde dehydrogenase
MNEDTNIGPIARKDLAEKVRAQIAKTLLKEQRPLLILSSISAESNFVAPTILTDVTPICVLFKKKFLVRCGR